MNQISKGATMHDPNCKSGPETCTDHECTSGARNNYFVGKRLSPKSFQIEQSYHIERRRLLNRVIHGWGIVYGFGIKAEPTPGKQQAKTLTIGAGFALDAAGRELILAGDEVLAFSALHAPELKKADSYSQQNPAPKCWVLSAHYAERKVDPVSLRDACSCDRKEWNRTCETIVFCLRPCDPKESDCKQCPPACEACLRCECASCDKEVGRSDRGPCACLCHAITSHVPKPPTPCWHQCNDGMRIDISAGVPLACVTIGVDCNEWEIVSIEALCEARRFVKGNDLLFDLLRGCDLTYVEEVSWEKELHRQTVSFETFSKYFCNYQEHENTETGFWIKFSGPVQRETVTTDCVTMRVFFRDGGWYLVRQLPIVDFRYDEIERKAHIVVDRDWVRDKIRHRPDEIFRRSDLAVYVEIEIRGDYILDCCGQPIDANTRGLLAAPGGNGTPGGTLLSRFTVKEDVNAARAAATNS